MDYRVGMIIKIVEMKGEPSYDGKFGIVTHVDSIGQLHGTWGGLAVQPENDTIEVIDSEARERISNQN